tara:strand:- start:5752 stop:5949 length:198 start_codon:yes stop_codon:yes gene_type:complete
LDKLPLPVIKYFEFRHQLFTTKTFSDKKEFAKETIYLDRFMSFIKSNPIIKKKIKRSKTIIIERK